MAIDVKKLTASIIDKIGGVDNISNVSHCVTRLRFVLKDKNLAKTEELKKLEGVLGVAFGAGQYQVILGENLFPVFDLIEKDYGIVTGEEVDEFHKEDLNLGKSQKGIRYYFQQSIQFLSSSLTPFITVLYGAGMLRVVLSLMSYFWPLVKVNTTFMMFDFLAQAPFYFMPILIAYGAARTLKSNPAFAIIMAAALLYPNYVSLIGGDLEITMFGLPVTVISYANTLLPAIFSALILAKLENFFYKWIPGVLRTVFAPLFTLAVAYPIVILVLGPLGTIVGAYVVNVFVAISSVSGGVAAAVMAGIQPFMVMMGMNMLFVAPMLEVFSKLGYDPIFRPGWILHNISQGGSCVGVAIRTKNKQLRSNAISAAIGAIVSGVSEPALYGINLRLKRPMISVVLGGVSGGVVAGLMGAKAFSMGYSSILAIPIFEATMFAIIAGILVSFFVSMATTMIIGFEDVEEIV